MIYGNFLMKPLDVVYYFKKIRKHNRKIYKDKILLKRKQKINECPYTVKNSHMYDLVMLYSVKVLVSA